MTKGLVVREDGVGIGRMEVGLWKRFLLTCCNGVKVSTGRYSLAGGYVSTGTAAAALRAWLTTWSGIWFRPPEDP